MELDLRRLPNVICPSCGCIQVDPPEGVFDDSGPSYFKCDGCSIALETETHATYMFTTKLEVVE